MLSIHDCPSLTAQQQDAAKTVLDTLRQSELTVAGIREVLEAVYAMLDEMAVLQ